MVDTAIRPLSRLVARTLRLLHSQRGQTLAEYGLIISVIAIATVTGAVIAFREQFIVLINTATNCLGGTCQSALPPAPRRRRAGTG